MQRVPIALALLALASLSRAGAADAALALRLGPVSPQEISVVVAAAETGEVRLEGTTGASAKPFATLAIAMEANQSQQVVLETSGAPLQGRIRVAARSETGATCEASVAAPPDRPGASLKLVVAGPPRADALATDLELAAAGMQAQGALGTVWLGATSAPTTGDHATARGYDRAARRLLTTPAWAGAWTTGANYGVLGAADYGPVGASRHWSLRADALAAFARSWPRPNQPLPETPGAYTFTLGDLDAFVLDGFSLADGVERAPGDRAILGEAQCTWLRNALATSRAPFKLIFCGRSLLPPREDGLCLQSFRSAARRLETTLAADGTSGIVVIASGGPTGELSRVIRAGGYPLHELSLGPLAGPGLRPSADEELNYFRVPGTLVREPHFAVLELRGTGEDRALRLSLHHPDGSEIWAETLLARDLRND